MIELEKIAHEAASQHSRCANCNGICPDTATNCDKSRMYVCPTYWNGYYTALDAMERLAKRLEIPIKEVEKENKVGLKETFHVLGEKHYLSDKIVDKAFPLNPETGLVDFSVCPIPYLG
jgi:RNA polymerase subunit RPABC4/transcription elongation factor Spt4